MTGRLLTIIGHEPWPGRRRRGSVLIIVMWMSLGLIAIALVFSNSMFFEYGASANNQAGTESNQAIEGMHRYLANILDNLETPGTMPDLENEDYVAEAVPIGDATCWLVGRDASNKNGNNASEPTWGLIDEAGKLNLNTATLDMLEALPNMPVKLAAAIIDWRDSDEDVTAGGAESQTYLALDPAYQCKNSPFESIEELRLVLGADWDLLYREDLNMNGVLDANENDGDVSLPVDNANGLLEPGLLEYVTVWSREKNTQSDGSARINITRPESVQSLSRMLREKLDSQKASQVMQKVGSSMTTMKSVLEFFIASGLSETDFATIEDALSVSSESTVQGLVNINHAPAEVLACLPGLDTNLAAELVSYRTGKTESELNSVAWVAGVIDKSKAIEAGPYLTAHTFQYRADITAVGAHGRGLRRVMMIFDTTGGEARVSYRRDLSRLGWPLGVTVRDELDTLNED